MSGALANARSKELLLDAMDNGILSAQTDGIGIEIAGGMVIVEADRELISAMIMNRNRVSRFLKLPTREFQRQRKKEQR